MGYGVFLKNIDLKNDEFPWDIGCFLFHQFLHLLDPGPVLQEVVLLVLISGNWSLSLNAKRKTRQKAGPI